MTHSVARSASAVHFPFSLSNLPLSLTLFFNPLQSTLPCVLDGVCPVDHEPGGVRPAGLGDGWRSVPLPLGVVHLAVGAGILDQHHQGASRQQECLPQCHDVLGSSAAAGWIYTGADLDFPRVPWNRGQILHSPASPHCCCMIFFSLSRYRGRCKNWIFRCCTLGAFVFYRNPKCPKEKLIWVTLFVEQGLFIVQLLYFA